MKYRKEIDGLRAVAVLPVVAFHAGAAWAAGGFVGVDVFFVISGYLITSIIVEEQARGSFTIAGFYERRARRILPALFFVMVCCIPFAYAWMLAPQLEEFAQSVAAVTLFVPNVFFWKQTGYFGTAAELKPLLHTWSLAVEEQYYLAFPPLVLLVWRYGKQYLFHVLAAIAGLSFIVAEWGWRHEPNANFFLTPGRAWELMAGALCALYLIKHRQKPNGWLAGAGLLLIGVAVFGFDRHTPSPSIYMTLPVIGTSLIILFAGAGTLTARILSHRVLVGIGLVSYSAYLWHQPLFAFARIRSITPVPGHVLFALALLSFGMAFVSWRFVEQPFRSRRGVLGTRRAVFACSAAASVLLLATGLITAPQATNISRFPVAPESTWKADVRGDLCLLQDKTADTFADQCFERGETNLLLWGDSHAAALYPGVRAFAEQRKIAVSQATSSGCPPIFDLPKLLHRKNCNEVNERVYRHLQDTDYDAVMLHAAWEHWDYPMSHETMEELVDASLDRILGKIPVHTEVYLVGPVPRWMTSSFNVFVRSYDDAADAMNPRAAPAEINREIETILRRVAKRNRVHYLSPAEHLCGKDDRCLVSTDGSIEGVTTVDYGHLSTSGAKELMNRIARTADL